MDNQKTLGQRIYELRTAAHETQEELAEAVETSHVSIARYENNIRVPKISILHRIAQHYNVPLDDLMGAQPDETKDSIDPELAAIEFALNGELKAMDKEQKRDVLDYVLFKKSQRKK